jgi:exodeoxyribonuclease-3
MRIASWNVNSLRVRLPQVLQWLQSAQPDLLGLQETKTADDAFPRAEIEELGYHVVYSGQKTYNGVAIVSRLDPEPQDIILDLPDFEDHQRRVLGATYGHVRLLNLYVPNGSEVGSDKYEYKLEWLNKLADYVGQQLKKHKKLVLVGDFNIAPEDRDVYDPEAWEGAVLCSEPEREAFRKLLDLGLVDTFRLFEQEEKAFSWWDYRAAAFRRNMGLRIDHILASSALKQVCESSIIDKEPRKWERPSDHAPVVAEFDIGK